MQNKFIWGAYIILVITVIAPRLGTLDAFTSPDESQWERNTQNFATALKKLDFKGFYQQPHPGITTQWLSVTSINASTWGEKRLPQALFLSMAILYIAYLVRRLWGDYTALLAGFLLALNPILIAHSRVLAMDALLSVFMLLAVLQHLLWLEQKKKSDIVLAGVFTALAILSKMSGVGLFAYFVIANAISMTGKKLSWKELREGAFLYIVALLITTSIIFPTILTDFHYVWQSSLKFLAGEHFTQQVHALGPWWYSNAFLIWTTPLQLAGILLLPIVLLKPSKYRLHILLITVFCLLFFLEIQYSTKKGDRYMLPDFVALDVLATLSIITMHTLTKRRYIKLAIGLVIVSVFSIGLQVRETLRLHPYLLAYRNPFFASLAHSRTMGWGEGLDIAADYLNKKPNAENLLVAAYYEGSFGYHFKGKFTSAERLAKESAEQIGADFVVLYRTMEGRAKDRWETKVLKEYSTKIPEKIISLNNEQYAWIYKVR